MVSIDFLPSLAIEVNEISSRSFFPPLLLLLLRQHSSPTVSGLFKISGKLSLCLEWCMRVAHATPHPVCSIPIARWCPPSQPFCTYTYYINLARISRRRTACMSHANGRKKEFPATPIAVTATIYLIYFYAIIIIIVMIVGCVCARPRPFAGRRTKAHTNISHSGNHLYNYSAREATTQPASVKRNKASWPRLCRHACTRYVHKSYARQASEKIIEGTTTTTTSGIAACGTTRSNSRTQSSSTIREIHKEKQTKIAISRRKC